jgi:hypothetical protein
MEELAIMLNPAREPISGREPQAHTIEFGTFKNRLAWTRLLTVAA